MGVRATRFVLTAVAALAMCGCNTESPYNIPTDPAKEAAAIGPAAPPRKVVVGRNKVAKPPGGGERKDANNLRPSE